MPFNKTISTPSQDTFVGLLFQYPNKVAGGVLGYMLLIAIYVIAFSAAMKGGDVMKAHITASFLTMGSSVFIMAFGIVGSSALIASIIAFLLGLALINR